MGIEGLVWHGPAPQFHSLLGCRSDSAPPMPAGGPAQDPPVEGRLAVVSR